MDALLNKQLLKYLIKLYLVKLRIIKFEELKSFIKDMTKFTFLKNAYIFIQK